MAVFCVLLEKRKEVKDFFFFVKDKLSSNNLINNPFLGNIRLFDKKEEYVLILSMKPLYPNFSFFGWLILFAMILFFNSFSYLMIIPFILGLLGFFWSSTFFYIMACLGLRKKGYCGKIKRVPVSKALEKVVFEGFV